ncbi:MAG TPA: lysyl oxidase family protein [Gaiellaceae bacterium]|nr:lysyl oxidase family protein [Gaiellaceae bacterium]
MRWALLLVLAAVLGLGLAAAGVALLAGGEPEDLLPDLDQAAPSAVSVVRVGDAYRLTFASAVDNLGRGPLVVHARRPHRGAPLMAVRQEIHRGDGSSRERATADRVRYVRSETHAHWHVLGFERYELRRARDGTLVAPDRKTGFCLGDRYDARPRARIDGEPPEPVWTGDCGKGRPGLLELSEGISPGYGDDYVPRLEGQYVELSDVPAGRYVLVHRANPERTLVESDYGNNAASVLIAVRRPAGEIPTVVVLARCPATADCSR